MIHIVFVYTGYFRPGAASAVPVNLVTVQTDMGDVSIKLQNGQVYAVGMMSTVGLTVTANTWNYLGLSWRYTDGRITVMLGTSGNVLSEKKNYAFALTRKVTVSVLVFVILL